MPVESIAPKTLGLKRHCVESVKDEKGQLAVYLSREKRYKLAYSGCHGKASGYDRHVERETMETCSSVGHTSGIGVCCEEGKVYRVWSESGRDPLGRGEEPSLGFSERGVGNVGEAGSLEGRGSRLWASLE
jgi:hypothetical protein